MVYFTSLPAGTNDHIQPVIKKQKRNGAMQEIPGSPGVFYQEAAVAALLEYMVHHEVSRLPPR